MDSGDDTANSENVRRTRSGKIVRTPPAVKAPVKKTRKKVVLMEVEVSEEEDETQPNNTQKSEEPEQNNGAASEDGHEEAPEEKAAMMEVVADVVETVTAATEDDDDAALSALIDERMAQEAEASKVVMEDGEEETFAEPVTEDIGDLQEIDEVVEEMDVVMGEEKNGVDVLSEPEPEPELEKGLKVEKEVENEKVEEKKESENGASEEEKSGDNENEDEEKPMMKNNKRQRGMNFTPNEKTLILKLIYDQRHIIQNKKTDAATNKQKMRCWEQITDTFNSQSPIGVMRSSTSIRKFYTNKKKEVRKEIARRNGSLKKTDDPSTSKGETLITMDEYSTHELKTEVDVDHVVCDKEEKEEVDDKELLKIHTEEFIGSTVINSTRGVKGFNHHDTDLASKEVSSQLNNEKSTQTISVVIISKLELDNVKTTRLIKSKFKEMATQTATCRLMSTCDVSHSSHFCETYCELAEKKLELVEAQTAAHKREEERKIVEFRLKRELLELEVQLKREELKRIKCSNM